MEKRYGNGYIYTQLTGSNVQYTFFQMDYIGKKSGQTWNIPHTVYANIGNSPLSPSTFGGSEIPDSAYKSLAMADGIIYAYTPALLVKYSEVLYKLDVLNGAKKLPNNASNISVQSVVSSINQPVIRWSGWGKGGANVYGATVKIWNYTTQAYDLVGTNTSSTSTEVSLAISNLSDYVDVNGKMDIIAYPTNIGNGTDSSPIATEYIRLEGYIDQNLYPQVSVITGKRSVHVVDAISSGSNAISTTGYFTLPNIEWASDGAIWIAADQDFRLYAWALDDVNHDARNAANRVELTPGLVTNAGTTVYFRYLLTSLLPAKALSFGLLNNSGTTAQNFKMSYLLTAL